MNLERKPIQCFTEIATKIISDLELGNLFFLYSYSYYLLSLFYLSNLFHLSNLFDSCTLFFLLCTRLCFEDRPTNRPTDQPTDRQTYRPSPRCFVATPKHKNSALYLPRFSRGGPIKFESTFFQIAKLRFSTISADFHQNSRIFKKFSADEFKS